MHKLFKQYPFRSLRKFVPIALEHGFKRSTAERFIRNLDHDVKYTRQQDAFLPIYDAHGDAYQFDTLVQSSEVTNRYQ